MKANMWPMRSKNCFYVIYYLFLNQIFLLLFLLANYMRPDFQKFARGVQSQNINCFYDRIFNICKHLLFQYSLALFTSKIYHKMPLYEASERPQSSLQRVPLLRPFTAHNFLLGISKIYLPYQFVCLFSWSHFQVNVTICNT